LAKPLNLNASTKIKKGGAILGLEEGRIHKYLLTAFCPRYSSADPVYLCTFGKNRDCDWGKQWSKDPRPLLKERRENSLIDMEAKLQMKN
jgi:hypothetical protein